MKVHIFAKQNCYSPDIEGLWVVYSLSLSLLVICLSLWNNFLGLPCIIMHDIVFVTLSYLRDLVSIPMTKDE
jgi:hypothetical protein